MGYDKREYEMVWSSYNHSFLDFFNEYKDLCLFLMDSRNIIKINKRVSSFILNFNYGVVENEKRNKFVSDIYKLQKEVLEDIKLQEIIKVIKNSDVVNFKIDVEYYKIYYNYFFRHLEILSEFKENLTETLMPNTTMQSKSIRFFNHQPFFDNFIAFKKIMNDKISSFSIESFLDSYNGILIYYYAYRLFINEMTRKTVENVFEVIYSEILNIEVVDILKKDTFSDENKIFIRNIEMDVFKQLHFCNEQINISFSIIGILPKINRKVYIDRTLI